MDGGKWSVVGGKFAADVRRMLGLGVGGGMVALRVVLSGAA